MKSFLVRLWFPLCIISMLASGGGTLWAEKAKSEKLLRELAMLEGEEKALSAERAPKPGMGEPERKKAADAFFAAGLRCHDLMRDYAESLGKKADLYLRASLAFSDSPKVRAFLGSSHLIQARDAELVFTKIGEVDAGLKELDAAVKAAPNDIGVRAIRIESTIELPEMFKRLDTVTEDLGFLLDVFAKDRNALSLAYDPARLLNFKAKELDLRGKTALADRYRQKAAELLKDKASPKS